MPTIKVQFDFLIFHIDTIFFGALLLYCFPYSNMYQFHWYLNLWLLPWAPPAAGTGVASSAYAPPLLPLAPWLVPLALSDTTHHISNFFQWAPQLRTKHLQLYGTLWSTNYYNCLYLYSPFWFSTKDNTIKNITNTQH